MKYANHRLEVEIYLTHEVVKIVIYGGELPAITVL